MNHKKKVPDYWWDFQHISDKEMHVIVESDDDRFPVLATFKSQTEKDITDAEDLIADLKAGRADPRELAKNYKGL